MILSGSVTDLVIRRFPATSLSTAYKYRVEFAVDPFVVHSRPPLRRSLSSASMSEVVREVYLVLHNSAREVKALTSLAFITNASPSVFRSCVAKAPEFMVRSPLLSYDLSNRSFLLFLGSPSRSPRRGRFLPTTVEHHLIQSFQNPTRILF